MEFDQAEKAIREGRRSVKRLEQALSDLLG
jgi:hypothetical protein